MASRSGRSRARRQSSGQLRGGCSRVSVGNVLASAVSVALPLLGIAPGASQERREVVRTASTRGLASSASDRTEGGAGINSIGNRRDLQMAEKDVCCVLIRNINPTIMAVGVDAPRDTKCSTELQGSVIDRIQTLTRMDLSDAYLQERWYRASLSEAIQVV